MSELSWIGIYSVLVLLVSLCGGYVPFIGRITHDRLQFYLSASAGVMLGASFFHIMPEAMKLAGDNFGWWMSLGVVGLFGIERFIAPHSHEMDVNGHHRHGHHQPPKEIVAVHEHGHEHGEDHQHGNDHVHTHGHEADERRAAAPAIAGWMAVLGLTIHTFMNGVGLAGAVKADLHGDSPAGHSFLAMSLPGLAIFLAIVLHKPADALAISVVLSRKGVQRRKIVFVQLGFGLMVLAGALGFLWMRELVEKSMESQLTGAALAFSAGTFLFVALSDLLPEVQFHRHDRVWLYLSLILGVALMGGIAYLEDRGEADHGHGAHDQAGHMESAKGTGHTDGHADDGHADHDHDAGHDRH